MIKFFPWKLKMELKNVSSDSFVKIRKRSY